MGPNGQTLLTTPGDTVAVSTDYSGSLNGGGTATFWLEDLTSSNYTMFTMNNVEYPGWRAADFINERPIINDHFLYLPDFGSSVFTDCFTEDDSGDIWYLVTSNNNRWYMTTNGLSSGTIMSEIQVPSTTTPMALRLIGRAQGHKDGGNLMMDEGVALSAQRHVNRAGGGDMWALSLAACH